MRVLKLFDVDIADLLHGESAPIHGCETDTSLLLVLAPHPIRWKLAHDYTMATSERRRYRRGGLKVAADAGGMTRFATSSASDVYYSA